MITPKSLARKSAVQALYQWQLTGCNLSEIERQFVEEHGIGKKELPYFNELLHSIPKLLSQLDEALGEFLDRPIDQVDPVERAILRVGAFELLEKPEIPYKVAVNEGINLAKEFGATQSHKFINGILDRIAKKHREAEFNLNRKKAKPAT